VVVVAVVVVVVVVAERLVAVSRKDYFKSRKTAQSIMTIVPDTRTNKATTRAGRERHCH
jgi:hypothetical protein